MANTVPKNEQLLLLMIESSNPQNVKWEVVAQGLGCTKNAAALRWLAYRQKLPSNSPLYAAPSTPRKGENGVSAKKANSTTSSGRKQRATNGKLNGRAGVGKKRELEDESEDEEDGEVDNDDDLDELKAVKTQKDKNMHAVKKVRRSPARRARGPSFAEENVDDDEKEVANGHEEGVDVYQDAEGFDEV